MNAACLHRCISLSAHGERRGTGARARGREVQMRLCPRGHMGASARMHQPVRTNGLMSALTHRRICVGATVLSPSNFITGATMHPSHGRPNGHRPSIRLSVHYRPRINPIVNPTSMNPYRDQGLFSLPCMHSNILISMVCMVYACYKWAGIEMQVWSIGLCLLFILVLPI